MHASRPAGFGNRLRPAGAEAPCSFHASAKSQGLLPGLHQTGKPCRQVQRGVGEALRAKHLCISICVCPLFAATRSRDSPAGVAATGESQPHGKVPSPSEARAAKFAGAVRSLNEQFLQWARSQWTAGKSGRFWSNGMLDYLRHSAIIRRDFADVPAAQGGGRPDHMQLDQGMARHTRRHISILCFWAVCPYPFIAEMLVLA